MFVTQGTATFRVLILEGFTVERLVYQFLTTASLPSQSHLQKSQLDHNPNLCLSDPGEQRKKLNFFFSKKKLVSLLTDSCSTLFLFFGPCKGGGGGSIIKLIFCTWGIHSEAHIFFLKSPCYSSKVVIRIIRAQCITEQWRAFMHRGISLRLKKPTKNIIKALIILVTPLT